MSLSEGTKTVLAYIHVYLLDLNKTACCGVIHYGGNWWKGVRTKLGGFMSEPSLVSHLPNLRPLHAHTRGFKFWRPLLQTTDSPLPFFICCLFRWSGKYHVVEPSFFLCSDHIYLLSTEVKASLLFFYVHTSCDSKQLPKPYLPHI